MRGRDLRAGIALAIVFGLIGASSRAWAQPTRPTYQLSVEGCDLPTLASAVSVELGDALALDGDRFIRVECVEATTRIVAEDTLLGIRMQREIEPQTVEPHLRARVLALLIAQLVRSLERLEREPASAIEPTTIEPTEPTAIETEPAASPPVVADVAEPVALSPRSGVELGFLGGIRLYPVDSTTVLTMIEIDVRFDWIALGVAGGGMRVPNRFAQVDLGVLVGNIGVVPLRLTEGSLDAGAGIFVEGGAVFGTTVSTLEGYAGASYTGVLLGAFARGWMSLAIEPRLSFLASVDVGYDYGLRVIVLGYPTASTDSLMIAVRLGLSFWP